MSGIKKPSRTLVNIAGIVAVATLISKIFGLVRQQAIAAAFGVGAAANAYSYAYILPGFLLVLLGGINGPFHSALVSVLAKREKEETAPIVETITTFVSGILLLVTIALIIFAEPLVNLVAPGLNQTQGVTVAQAQTLALTKAIAIQQLQIMAPMALFAGLIGIGFATLNAADQYWLPSISPLFSSITVIGGLAGLAIALGGKITTNEYAMLGGQVLAIGTLAGAILQWLVQVIAQWRSGLGTLRLRFDFHNSGVKEVLRIMAPATFSSGMLHINVYTDLFFASFIPKAAASLSYAGLLVQTPLGIISNVLLVPFLPIFSRLADPKDWPELKQRIRQALILTALTMLPLGAIMVSLAMPIVQVVYQRGAFDKQASQLVASLLVVYGMGMFFYLGRDVLVRVFYALGDGDTPFRISIFNIFLNALLDFIFFKPLGAPGLVLATMTVNMTSMIFLTWRLHQKINGLPMKTWAIKIGALGGASVFTGVVSWTVSWGFQRVIPNQNLLTQLIELTIASLVGLAFFAFFATKLKLPEVDILVSRIKQKLGR
ncbi:murein biosynthesis integral membrane protein MurJ [Phormidium sp. LEGE 05292]|uniref:murein biosynthesis integral membrane protein MurJ n=1 Tax=[Phormidium] sp. LEGE 05292 TaxID=767427 RepID=UPI0018811CA6|nr:murein biosynthesis integral membrane protein MurJ [Phormidium sp. LEGE 05292]MBE9227704.1 murein biosynthesis integral membrane protein MurJ [Phormidium sp. LEGE 05292]